LAVAAGRVNDLGDVVDALRGAKRITAICHENPDADTIGAAVAVCIIAERLGAEAEIVSADGIPPVFNFLPHVARVQRQPMLEPDLAVVCDAATLERVGRIAREHAGWFERARLLNIDHHVSSNLFGDLNLVDPRAAATCEVLERVVEALEIDVDIELATALLTGIVRDSHGFSDPATSGDTLRAAARLVDAGAPLAMIHRRILSELPFQTMALWGKMLAGVGQDSDGRIVHATLTKAMLDETGTAQHDADGLAEFLAKAKGADVTLLLRELGPTETRVSVRTSEAVDATAITARFGGGGHARRAGCTVPHHVDEATGLIVAASREELPRIPGAST
jgi:phosphoesterase RecJ-like protein